MNTIIITTITIIITITIDCSAWGRGSPQPWLSSQGGAKEPRSQAPKALKSPQTLTGDILGLYWGLCELQPLKCSKGTTGVLGGS